MKPIWTIAAAAAPKSEDVDKETGYSRAVDVVTDLGVQLYFASFAAARAAAELEGATLGFVALEPETVAIVPARDTLPSPGLEVAPRPRRTFAPSTAVRHGITNPTSPEAVALRAERAEKRRATLRLPPEAGRG